MNANNRIRQNGFDRLSYPYRKALNSDQLPATVATEPALNSEVAA